MLQAKPIKKYLPLILFIALFLLTRLPYLAFDEINPDGVNWHYRSEQFVVGLKTQNWLKTYQHYHPGVTLMWIMGVPVEIVKQLSPVDKTYNLANFETFHFVSKFSLVFVQLILSLVIWHVLSRLVGFWKSLFVTALFTFEPFFVGNSRILHMDVLLAQFLFLGLLLSFLNYKKFNWFVGLFAGVSLSLAFLTKSLGILGILFALVIGGIFVFKKSGLKQVLLYIISILIPFVLTTFVLFPALWVSPVATITDIFSEGERIGIRNGHGQILFGEYTRDAGIFFYPLTLLMKVSPIIWFGIILFFLKFKKMDSKDFILYMSLFFLGYFLIMFYPSKKIDRYMIPMYPFLALIAVVGYAKFYETLSISQQNYYKVTQLLLVLLFMIYPLFRLYPYYFLYTSPLFINSSVANSVIAQKPFGIGIHDLKKYLFEKYGYYPRLGFIDTKPMRAIYMNSRIFDIRVNGTNDYEVLVLGVNETFPEEVDENKFQLDGSVYINGLEYWRTYVKKAK